MSILVLLGIPIILAIIFFIASDGITLKEFLAQTGIQIVIAGISAAILFFSNVTFTEIWNGFIVNKKRVEVSCEHSYECNCRYESYSCGTSKRPQTCSRRVCDTCYEHSYDVDWRIYDSVNYSWNIHRIDRQGLSQPPRWTIAKLGEPTSHSHWYKNYIKAAPGTLFKKQGLANKYLKKDLLPEYPSDIYDYYKLDRIVNVGSPITSGEIEGGNQILSLINAKLGHDKQVNAILVITNQPREYFYALEQHWLGANKNDAVLVVGVDKERTIQWSEVMAMVTDNTFKVELKSSIEELDKFDMVRILQRFEVCIFRFFNRKPMADFEYLMASITPSMTQWIITLIIGVGAALGMSYFFHHEDPFD